MVHNFGYKFDIEFIQKSEKSFNDNLNVTKDDELYIETEKAVKKRCDILNKETGYTMISIYDNLNVDGYERIDY